MYIIFVAPINSHTMKTLSNLFKTVLFTVVCLLAITTIYWGFNVLFYYLLSFLAYLSGVMSAFVLYLTLFFIGITIVSMIWGLFKMLAGLIVFKVAKITPYKNYAGVVIMILSLLCTITSIWYFWYYIGWQNVATGIYIVIVSIFAVSLLSSLCTASYNSLFKEEDSYLETN